MELVTTTKGFLFEPTKEPHTNGGMFMFITLVIFSLWSFSLSPSASIADVQRNICITKLDHTFMHRSSTFSFFVLFYELCIFRLSCTIGNMVCNSLCSIQRWSRGHKARGQGQGHQKNPRLRPRTAFPKTLTRPRTEMLEAKDQGHSRKCSPKKKVFKEVFQAISNL